MEALPSKVDVIVLGTGLPESIVSAACSRSGLSVLHLDRNNYYGGSWASFNFKTIDDWIKSPEENKEEPSSIEVELSEGEVQIAFGRRKMFKNVKAEAKSESENTTTVKKRTGETEEMTYRAFLDQEWRRFSIDIVPKMIVSDSEMTQVLIDSEVSKYAEFKLVDRFLCMELKEKGEGLNYCPVPCSRGEIFQSKSLSMMDKRRLMMFMDFCQKWKAHQVAGQTIDDPIYQEYKNKPFENFLESNRFQIKDKLRYFITDAIGILHPNATTEEGLEAVCTFVNSTGRFGASPFLFPLYGCGELPQCFCRLCAVFGGLYCLDRPVESLILKDNKVVGVVAAGQRIDCSHLIMSNVYVPDEYVKEEGRWINRAVHITNKSILTDPNDKERISLVNLSQLNPNLATRLFEAGFEACAAPKGYYVLHLTGKGDNEKEMEDIEKTIFSGEDHPQPLWSLHFSALVNLELNQLPENVAVMPGADESLEFAPILTLARQVFKSFWNDVDFLPKALRPTEEEDEEPNPVSEWPADSESLEKQPTESS